MNYRAVIRALGRLLHMLAGAMLVPLAIAYVELWPMSLAGMLGDGRFVGFVVAVVSAFITGLVLQRVPEQGIRGNAVREGFAIVTFGWIVLTFFGAIPLLVYFLSTHDHVGPGVLFRCFTDAYFEIMSGFTTTGATILTDIESVSRGILFWRSMTHWLGGMGIVTLVLAVFPAFGIAGYQMFRGEVPGPTAERLRPRLAQTAKILWGVYSVLTLAEVILLWMGGMSLFESFCHAFGTMATGGFSTRNASIAAYDSDFVHWVIVLFMVFAGTNFMIHFSVLRGNFSIARRDRELRFYLAVMGGAVVVGTLLLWAQGLADPQTALASFRHAPPGAEGMAAKVAAESGKVGSLYASLKHTAFQVVSITTTTGYCTADFDLWPGAIRLMLVILMFFGGCAGSTGGGIKMVRVMVVLKATWRQIRREIQPRLLLPVKVGGRALDEKQVSGIVGFFVTFILLFVLFSLVMSFMVPDFTTAVTSVVATLCNIGPGLSGIGATENYAWIPLGGKWVLSLCMLLGRLEVYTVLIAIVPPAWRR